MAPDRLRLAMCAVGCLTLATGVFARADTSARQGRKTVWDGVYTKVQARRGQQTYTEVCVYCHGPDLNGDEMGPPLKGAAFFAAFRDQPVVQLFVKIGETMPNNNPGTLSPQAAIDVASFLLEANKVPAGNVELPTDPAALEQIVITDKPAQ